MYIHPRRRRGGGNVVIAAAIFQGLWEGWENSLIVFPGFPQTVISTACLDRPNSQAAIFTVESIQSFSNCIGLA